MNAYELADELENYVWMNPNNNRDYCKEVKDMLRQQADELEAFKLNFYNTGYTLQLRDKDETIRQQADLIAELEDKLSMYEIKDLDTGIIGKTKDYVIHDLVHRTTPQIKELSDEEIINLYKETKADNGGIREFVRAILKKASEK